MKIIEKTKYYAYFFTRQDISPEQQIVQTAHVALKLGAESQKAIDVDAGVEYVPHRGMDIDPDNTYFTVIGVRNLEALLGVYEILTKFDYRFEVFVEPDMNSEITAIGVYPIAEYNRGPLLAFNWLKISKG